MNQRFFSIIIPAHNEEVLIEQMLLSLKQLEYPTTHYEVIVVENSSTDKTYELSKMYESSNVKVFQTKEKGVSKARNFGIHMCAPNTEWSIVLDADTSLKSLFLNELNMFLDMHPLATYGMTALTPNKNTLTARFWFWYRNQTDKLMKTLDTIHIVKKELLSKVHYSEEFNFTEDLQYADELKKCGVYFFMPTKSLITSTRRYEEKGYMNMFFMNLIIGFKYIFKRESLKNKSWEIIREDK